LPCRKKKKLDVGSRIDVVEIARVPDMLPSLFPSWSSQGLISTPVHEDQYTIMIIPRSIIPRMKNVSDKNSKESKIVPFMR